MSTNPACTQEIHIRWMIRRDLEHMHGLRQRDITQSQFAEPICQLLRQRNIIGMVLERGDLIEGYFVYALEKTQLDVLIVELADEGYWTDEEMLGAITEKLTNKLSSHRRKALTLWIDAYDVRAQWALSKLGWRAEKESNGKMLFTWKLFGVNQRVNLPEPWEASGFFDYEQTRIGDID